MWHEVIAFALMLAGLVLDGWKVLGLRRSGVSRRNRNSPMAALRSSERWAVNRPIQGKVPLDPLQLMLLRAVAERQRDLSDFAGIYVGLALVYIGQVARSVSVTRAVYFAVTLAVGAIAIRRSGQRARTFWPVIRRGRRPQDINLMGSAVATKPYTRPPALSAWPATAAVSGRAAGRADWSRTEGASPPAGARDRQGVDATFAPR